MKKYFLISVLDCVEFYAINDTEAIDIAKRKANYNNSWTLLDEWLDELLNYNK